MSDPEETAPPVGNLPKDAPWWARWLVANVRDAWKWASVQFPALIAVLIPFYAAYQEKVHAWIAANIPAKYWPWIALLGCILQIIFRLTKLKGNQ